MKNKILIQPNKRYKNHYYYDEPSKEWFYIIDAYPKTEQWLIDYVYHCITGWKHANSPRCCRMPLNVKHFANNPFVV